MTIEATAAPSRLAEILDRNESPAPDVRPWWQRRRALVALTAAAVLVTAVVASRAFGSSGGQYRTVEVTERVVDSTLTDVATIEPVSQADIAFPVSGTVATVDVAVGDTVTVGQSLATLDRQALETTLHENEAALAQAELTLERALNGEAASGPSGGTTGGTTGETTPDALGVAATDATSGTEIRFVSAMTTSSDPAIAAAQQAVLDAQQAVDAALGVAGNAVANASSVCGLIVPAPPPTTAQIAACQTAISDALAAQQVVQAAQDALVDACDVLDALLEAKANQPTTPTAPPSDTPSAPEAGEPSGAPSDGGAAGGTSPSSADLVAYQKAIDAARLEVDVARQALHQATIASPIAGVVVAVSLEPGLSVDAASSTQTIVVQGEGGYEASTLITVERVSDVRVGQDATVVSDRSGRSLAGKVAYISTVPYAEGDGSSYLVVIGLEDSTSDDLRNGETATATIVLERASEAIAVPTSAVANQGTRHIVRVLDNGEVRDVTVTVGVIGGSWTEVTSGLRAEQEVVLADLDEPLPDSATSSDGSGGTVFQIPGGSGGGPRFQVGG